MKAKTIDKRKKLDWGFSWGHRAVSWGLSEERGCYKHLYIISRETRQTAEEEMEAEVSTELGTRRSVVESRDKYKDRKVAGGCCFPLRLFHHIRHMYQGEYLGNLGILGIFRIFHP